MAHSLTSNLASGDFNSTSFANDALVFNLLITAASTLPILYRAEDALTEQTVTLRLERTVVNSLWLLYFAVRPPHDVFTARDSDSDLVEQADVCHISFLSPTSRLLERDPTDSQFGDRSLKALSILRQTSGQTQPHKLLGPDGHFM